MTIPIHDPRIREMTLERKSARVIAAEVGLSERTVVRARARMKIQDVNTAPHLTADQVEQIKRLCADWQPANWVAETVGVSRETVNRHAPPRAGDVEEWNVAWAAIMRRPALLALHQEFAPKARR